MKYLIGIDLDGTLLTDKKNISNYNKQILSKLIEDGHLVCLVTGRSYAGAINYYNELNLNTPLIVNNGAKTKFINGGSINKYIESNFIHYYLNEVMPLTTYTVLNSPDYVHGTNGDRSLENLFNGALHEMYDYINPSNTYDNLVSIVTAVLKSNMTVFEDKFKNKNINPRLWGVYDGIALYDLHVNEISKASALGDVLSHYGLSVDNLITIGDGPNDLEMLKMTINGIAMKNAPHEVKSFANQTTKYDNNNDGVGKHLESLLIK